MLDGYERVPNDTALLTDSSTLFSTAIQIRYTSRDQVGREKVSHAGPSYIVATIQATDAARLYFRPTALVVWYSANVNSNPAFEPMAKYFGIWHENRRGAHQGMHNLWWQGKSLQGMADTTKPSYRVLLVNTDPSAHSPFSSLRPSEGGLEVSAFGNGRFR